MSLHPWPDKAPTAPICPYCGDEAKLRDSCIVYSRSRSFGFLWVCRNYPECDSYCGVHKATNEPLGSLANKPLRALRKQAHEALDRHWKGKGHGMRYKCYKRLSERLNLPLNQTHIGMFTEDQCRQTISICGPPPKPVY